jgi:acyl-[acyl-carrier-protein] desaturase
MSDTTEKDLLGALDGDVERLYNRHLESPRSWYPHEQINWGKGESFGTRAWSETDYPLPAGVRSAILINLLTEDALPFYTTTLMRLSREGHPVRDWNRQWTMEENRHSMVMRDWVHISRCIDPVLLEDGRRIHLSRGIVPEPETFTDMICYVSYQERATQIAHRNTMMHLAKDDKMGRGVLGVIAGDETKHYLFYRDLVKAGLEVDPSSLVKAARTQALNFAMPGAAIPNFNRHAVRISREGIYGLDQFINGVLEPTLEHWNFWNLEGLDGEAEVAREEMATAITQLKGRIALDQERRSAQAAVEQVS